VRAAAPRARVAFEERLRAALEPAQAAGAVVTFETGDYHPERARFGGALDAAHDVFESDSDATCALLATPADERAAADDTLARLTPLVRMLDALARGLGLEGQARHDVARARRGAAEGGPLADDARCAADAEFRARARDLRTLLGAPPRDAATRTLEAHAARTARAVRGLPPAARAALAPTLLHLTCVRVAGPDGELERLAYTCWERTLEGLRRAPLASSAPRRRARTFRRARAQAT
jgi:thiopeptide-type bacteriocin biosynthesis protein